MGQAWYYTRGTEQAGPVEWEELQRMAAVSRLAPNDRVWTEGFTDWMTASTVRDLFAPQSAPQAAPVSAPAPVTPVVPMPAGASAASIPYINYAAIAGPQVAYAGFFMRFLASFIDGVIVLAMVFGAAAGFIWFVGEDTARANQQMMSTSLKVLVVVIAWMYYATLESGPKQSTLGKRLLGLRVTDMAGNQISFIRASTRHFGKFVSQFLFCIGYLMMKFTPHSQCLHDMLAGCVVVKKEWS
jgi:uncharacterized RDD family membrane protein YckC